MKRFGFSENSFTPAERICKASCGAAGLYPLGVKIRSQVHILAPVGAVECGPRRKPWDWARDTSPAAAAATEEFLQLLMRFCRPLRGWSAKFEEMRQSHSFRYGPHNGAPPGLKSWHDFLILTPIGVFPGAAPGVMEFIMIYVGIAPGGNKPHTSGGARNDYSRAVALSRNGNVYGARSTIKFAAEEILE